MKLALNAATIMQSALADDVEIAAETGFTALEVWAGKLDAYMRERSLDELAHQMGSPGAWPAAQTTGVSLALPAWGTARAFRIA
ncbi:MAG: hypothetical protein M3P30_15500 [Chloroflexota bacterium]|nr:hypothetical protein [Chloroflexota bacterium]